MESSITRWRQFKAKVVVQFGTMRRAAEHFDCSEEAIRMAVNDPERCRNVRQKLENAGLIETPANA